VRKLGIAVLVSALVACGGGNDTSSNAGGDTSLGTSSAESGTSASSGTPGPEAPASSGESGSASPSGFAGTNDSSADSVYRGELTATLRGESVIPVTDSTDLVIQVSGTEVTVTAEGRSYKGTLKEDKSFAVNIPIDEESRGIVCRGTPRLLGGVHDDGTVSGTVEGTGECSSETASIPVSVEGSFTARK
jgi:hypothetical protein